MTLISEEYRALQRSLHNDRRYGQSAHKHAPEVLKTGYTDILDYGCGKRSLQKVLGFPIACYDPAIESFADPPEPHDFVFCGDVLEHIEPECLDEVLKDIKRCMKKEGLLIISTRKANRVLPDGRNAHLIIESAKWWRQKLSRYFDITFMGSTGDDVTFYVKV